jgi:hypothetical protein
MTFIIVCVKVRVRAGNNSGTEFRELSGDELDGIPGIPSDSGIAGNSE